MKKIWKFHRWVKDPATDTWREPGYARAGRRPSGGTQTWAKVSKSGTGLPRAFQGQSKEVSGCR